MKDILSCVMGRGRPVFFTNSYRNDLLSELIQCRAELVIFDRDFTFTHARDLSGACRHAKSLQVWQRADIYRALLVSA